MAFPEHRPRRLRRSAELRRLVRETRVEPGDLIYPLFCVTGRGVREPVVSMPGIDRLSVDQLAAEAKDIQALGLAAVILFGIPDHKDALGTDGYDPDGIVQRAIRAIKDATPDLVVIADVCLCEYTDHGHCGVYDGVHVNNDATLPLLARTAVALAQAGADIVAPSDMMDGRVAAIRRALDAEGQSDTAILSYAAKYASAFYGPFRDAAESTLAAGDRRGYQLDPANAREALDEIAADLEEGADMVMVKPALPYLDVIHAARAAFRAPLFAYQVSGEYSLIRAAAERGWIDEERAIDESLTAIRRAGADRVITYFAKQFAHGFRG
ncbi:MAG: porphobilinogen synthase [Deltaproteobacteria bacterium]|nr:porphobilinogen synthase [Deltaproteobacteria bacterium]TDJ00894.1 MAG: porphobilinogen synthase [Deltaproteobacteria bacterium]